MKKFFYLMCVCLFASVAVMTSCNKEEKHEIEMSSLEKGTHENGNTVTHVVIRNNEFALLFTATFDDNNKCNSLLQQYVYATNAAAEKAWPEWQEDINDPEHLSIKSNVITWNRSEEFKGKSKTEVIEFVQNF